MNTHCKFVLAGRGTDVALDMRCYLQGGELMTPPKQIDSLRQRLIKEQARLSGNRSRRCTPTEPQVIAEDERGPTAYDEFVAAQLDEIEIDLLRQVEQALGRIAMKTYGHCSECAKPIEDRRLNAIPWAERCFACEVIRKCRELDTSNSRSQAA